MTRPAICVDERDSLLDAAKTMGAREVHRVVVTGREGRVVGILSSSDVLRWISRVLPAGEGVAGVLRQGYAPHGPVTLAVGTPPGWRQEQLGPRVRELARPRGRAGAGAVAL